ncbi:hypothetical protein [Reyranella soli]|uniref:Uncharacterized protein n=1 Tax=Reyranella soli TaxID=1230389 RepID=A0A512N5S9_9HYPH|nr:hypothetical protein [Reyranella soli]GEP54357.1 hypothetical protein RSO01_15230 [Reyranella soli]
MDYLKELANRADFSAWQSWSMQYRVLAVVVGLLVAWLALRSVLPAMLQLLRPALFIVVVLIAVWALFPAETCSIEILARLPKLCAR